MVSQGEWNIRIYKRYLHRQTWPTIRYFVAEFNRNVNIFGGPVICLNWLMMPFGGWGFEWDTCQLSNHWWNNLSQWPQRRKDDDDYDNSIIHVNGITTGLSNRTGISNQPIGLDKPNLKSLSEWYEEMWNQSNIQLGAHPPYRQTFLLIHLTYEWNLHSMGLNIYDCR